MSKKVALVTGATGIQGDPLLRLLEADEGWGKIFAVSRRDLPQYERVTSIQVDLTDKKALGEQLKSKDVQGVTHIFHLAFSGDVSNTDLTTMHMLENLIENVEQAGDTLQHVYFTSGTKHYGNHLGPPKTPIDERDSRHMPPNFYYNQEDMLIERTEKGAKWTWSTLRPGPVIGTGLGGTMNLLLCIAGFGVFAKEYGIDMRFPGSLTTYNALWDCVDVDVLMEAALWTSTAEAAKNHAFNINNGDVYRWSEVWPKIAAWFGLAAGAPQTVPLAKLMADKADKWKEIKEKYKLADIAYEDIFRWDFGDAMLGAPFDSFSNCNKLRQAGFNGMKVDSSTMYIGKLNELADKKIIPQYSKPVLPSLLEQSI